MKHMSIILYGISFILIVFLLLFVMERAKSDDPYIAYGDDPENATVGIHQAVDIVKGSTLYQRFDRYKKIIRISAKALNRTIPEDEQLYSIIESEENLRIEHPIYLIKVDSTSRCLSTSYLIFYVDSGSGDIIRTKSWRLCRPVLGS